MDLDHRGIELADGDLGHDVEPPQRIKLAANQRDVPDRSLIKQWLPEKVEAGR